ncbi:NAD(P)/FAD-dependent oxidoreductase [Caldalkalibacillus mannanilyticus]|uniref:NAD(P)/FAD-dependent oxidoreductase n=1 Tax=Caldalkalibacillus mannanilyticus TaxID=1418 RepID=UPI000469CE6C|nr:NAD(P)/FAD-dependent oxidoreductase [Caldalkalibacillus mannanilyticus]
MYDCIIIGGGIAGLQAAIQLGRYEHQVLVVDSDYGRSTLCRAYHNLLGWPNGVSGDELRKLGREHAEKLGIEFVQDEVVRAEKQGELFTVQGKKEEATYQAKRLLLATGVLDRFPPLPGLVPCLGLSVYVCPDCDGYEVKNKRTVVLGAGNTGASMALTLISWTDDLVYINHDQKELKEEFRLKLDQNNITYIEQPIERVLTEKEWEFRGVQLTNGEEIRGDKGFIAFGGNEVKSQLAKQLGIERLENKHILTDPRSKMTSVKHVWAAGDVVAHSEQVTIAMGEGSQAAIWIHKSLINENK